MSSRATLGADTSGVWSRGDARAVMSLGALHRVVASGAWQVPWEGVYADGGFVLDPVQRGFAAVLASGGVAQAWPCGRSAARIWRFPLIDDDDPATQSHQDLHDDVAVAGHLRDVAFGGRRLHRYQLALAPADLVTHPSGLVLTTPLRTLADCARLLSLEALVCCLDDALRREVVTPAQLADVIDKRKGLAGTPRLREAAGLADGRAEAPSESLLRLVVLPHFPRLEPQVRLFNGGRLIARFDLGDEAARVALEADGRKGHQGMAAKDRRRDRSARNLGWLTERFTWFDIRRRQHEVVARAREVYAEQERRNV